MSKKKVTQKAPEPKAKYALDQLVYHIIYHKGLPEELLQLKVAIVTKKTSPLRDVSGRKIGTFTYYSYLITKANGMHEELPEAALYPSFFEAAKVFAKAFLTLLK